MLTKIKAMANINKHYCSGTFEEGRQFFFFLSQCGF